MSAFGQKQTWRQALAMSALPPKADIGRAQVCFGYARGLRARTFARAQLFLNKLTGKYSERRRVI